MSADGRDHDGESAGDGVQRQHLVPEKWMVVDTVSQ